MGRGIEKRKLFLNNEDRSDFVARLKILVHDGAIEIYAWALMPNHFHLLCKTKNRPLAAGMRKLLTGYAVNFNNRHRRHGHLFQNRYKSIVCQEDRYLLELVRYIHLNPLRAGLIRELRQLDRYPWSGHSALMGKLKRAWQATEYVLSFYGKNGNRHKEYRKLIAKERKLGRRPELVGGGLVRSLGGWSEVLAMRRRGHKQASDQRVLGDSAFVEEITADVNDFVKNNLRISAPQLDMDELAQRVCNQYNLTPVELCSGTRRQDGVNARRALSWIAVRELGFSGADVARFLGVTNSCITRFVSAGIKPDVDDLMSQL
jgi:REP element-mobilizing transposase RayT